MCQVMMLPGCGSVGVGEGEAGDRTLECIEDLGGKKSGSEENKGKSLTGH